MLCWATGYPALRAGSPIPRSCAQRRLTALTSGILRVPALRMAGCPWGRKAGGGVQDPAPCCLVAGCAALGRDALLSQALGLGFLADGLLGLGRDLLHLLH